MGDPRDGCSGSPNHPPRQSKGRFLESRRLSTAVASIPLSPVLSRRETPQQSFRARHSHVQFLVQKSGNHRFQHLAPSTGPSVSEAAWGKVNLTAKAIREGGFESLFKQIFATEPNERLKGTFACYLSTTTGPVAGTLYLSTVRVGFCSDRPLCFKAPSGQETWSYYMVSIPWGNIARVNPIVTIDNHDFWFMGFVNFGKASHHLLSFVSEFRALESGKREHV
ncbi:GRAM domain [Dillenia turbinata]|uniref:GRAM domain n=1 Tax=Dillenia turbinata TaxID=194707 RepID=A0AAN8UV48_9MAGN